MRAVMIFLAFLLAALLLASSVSYPLLAWTGWELSSDGLTEVLAKLLALALFFPLLRVLGLRMADDLGWQRGRRPWVLIGWGLLEGFLMVLPVALVLLGLGVRELHSWDALPLALAKALVSGLIGGLLIGVIEESFFRGAVLSLALRGDRRHRLALSVLLVSVFYAGLHFIQVQALPAGTLWHWYNGSLELLNGLGDYFRLYFSFSSFLTLILAGVLLSLIRLRDGDIYRVIGIHAGSVLVIRLLRNTTEVNHGSDWIGWVGRYDYVTGWVASVWLGLVLLLLWRLGRLQIR